MLPAGRDLSRTYDQVELEVLERHRPRLDLYLQRRLGWQSRSKVQKLIRLGRVRINGEQPKVSTRVARGDRILLALAGSPGPRPGAAPAAASRDEQSATRKALRILWEDPSFLALDKPPHRLVHPVGRTLTGTVINELHARFAELNRRGRRPVVPKLCHRLDRETSGLLLVAKTDLARSALARQFEAGEVDKEYLALVLGSFPPGEHEIDLPVAPTLDRSRARGHRLARVDATGRPSVTRFRLVRGGSTHSLVLCRPLTGRQNQIRAHLAHAGFPILGDVGYGAPPGSGLPLGISNDNPREEGERALLHSASLTFLHPLWAVRLRLEAPLPADFRSFTE